MASHDVLQTALAWELALFVAFTVNDEVRPAALLWTTPVAMLLGAGVYHWRGLYRGIWHYASLRDLFNILQAVAVVVGLLALVLFMITRLESVPRSALVYFFPVLFILLSGPRVAYRAFKDGNLRVILQREDGTRIPVLLIGAGDEADLFIREMARSRTGAYRVVGMVATSAGRVGRDIRGCRVLGTVDELSAILKMLSDRGNRPHRVVLTNTKLEGDALTTVLKTVSDAGMTMARLPRLTDFKAGQQVHEIRPVDVADLLGRPQRVLDRQKIAALVADKRVLITGAGGTIGGELARQIAALGPAHLALMDNSEYALYLIDMELQEKHPDVVRRSVLGDVRDQARVRHVFNREKPQVVFHAAAFKHVPLVEANPNEGLLTNIQGTRVVADAAQACGVETMVMISTDKAVNPTNVMGASKRVAEMYCQALAMAEETTTQFVTVRFGNVLGSTGSVVPLFQRQLARGGPLTVTHPDVTRFFMTVPEAVELVLQASATAPEITGTGPDRARIFVLDMGEAVRIQDLARNMIRLAGLVPDQDISVVFTGLRPGEKLYEEVLHDAEGTVPTPLDGILLGAPRVVDVSILRPQLDTLLAAAEDRATDRALEVLRGLVPEYAPSRPEDIQLPKTNP